MNPSNLALHPTTNLFLDMNQSFPPPFFVYVYIFIIIILCACFCQFQLFFNFVLLATRFMGGCEGLDGGTGDGTL